MKPFPSPSLYLAHPYGKWIFAQRAGAVWVSVCVCCIFKCNHHDNVKVSCKFVHFAYILGALYFPLVITLHFHSTKLLASPRFAESLLLANILIKMFPLYMRVFYLKKKLLILKTKQALIDRCLKFFFF
jgi:hypothetical protein